MTRELSTQSAAKQKTYYPGREYEVKSVTKAIDLLCCFTTDHPEWGVTELASYLGLYKSAAHRLLSTFEQLRFVERTPSRRYRLGIRALELGNLFQLNDHLIGASERGLRILAEETKSITHLSKLDGRDTIELLRYSAVEPNALPAKANVRREAHATAKGKIFLAYAPGFFARFVGQRRFLKKYTPHTVGTPEKLRKELGEILEQGYAVDNEESHIGMRCLAVPVYTSSGELAAAMSISNATENMPADDLRPWVVQLVRLSRAITQGLVNRCA